MTHTRKIVLFISICLSSCDSARILNINAVSSRSHFILGNELCKALADAGHDVTYISPYKEEYTPKNGTGKYRGIELVGLEEEFRQTMIAQGQNMFEDPPPGILFTLIFGQFTTNMAETALNRTEIQQLIKSGEKFDVFLLELFGMEALKSLSTHFGAHLVPYSAIGSTWCVNHYSGTPSLPSYHPETIFLPLPVRMNFWQRLKNTIYTIVVSAATQLYYHPQHDKLVKKYISPDLSVYDALYNQSLLLVNTHLSVSPALPQVPQIVHIGGFHVKPPKKLPEDIQKFLDNSKDGVVLFSMGSVLKSNEMPVAKRDIILKTLAKFKQNFLWKWEDETLPELPPNVKTMKWLPQADILAHPNVRAFITHCGHGGFTESVTNGKPMIALPMFGDQPSNAVKVGELGMGVSVDFRKLTEEDFTNAIKEVVENPRYAENAKRISSLYKDRRTSGKEDAVYWIEYILRHNGARHLRVVSLDLPWYQYYLIDVLFFIFSIIFVFIFVIKTLWRKIRCTKKEKVKTK